MNKFIFIIIISLFEGCVSIPSPAIRQQTIDTIAVQHNLKVQIVKGTNFSLYSLADTSHCKNQNMRVYIEGDGLAWITARKLSDNPTPINPLGAKLMALDPSSCKIYLARPCQYTNENKCSSQYWNKQRFSLEVIENYMQILNKLKSEYKISSFALIGYSGGAAIATLSASLRSDVIKLITIAGNIDTDKWIALHNISPLEGSINPANYSSTLKFIPQTHLIGSKDTIIPPVIFDSYKKHFSSDINIKSIICEKCTHSDGWIEEWTKYLKQQ